MAATPKTTTKTRKTTPKTAVPVESAQQNTYHHNSNEDINTSGLWSSLYNTILFGLRATSRATLAADAAVYKTTHVAIKALDNLDIK